MLRSDESNPFDIRLFFNPPFHGSPEGSLRRGAAGREGPDAGRTLGKVLSTSCSGSLEGPWTALKRGKDGVLDRLFSSLGQGPEEPERGPGAVALFRPSRSRTSWAGPSIRASWSRTFGWTQAAEEGVNFIQVGRVVRGRRVDQLGRRSASRNGRGQRSSTSGSSRSAGRPGFPEEGVGGSASWSPSAGQARAQGGGTVVNQLIGAVGARRVKKGDGQPERCVRGSAGSGRAWPTGWVAEPVVRPVSCQPVDPGRDGGRVF